MARDWGAERQWVESICQPQIKALTEREMLPLAEEVADDVNALQSRITALEATVTELMAALEIRVGDLEKRVVLKPPRLVGGSDAA